MKDSVTNSVTLPIIDDMATLLFYISKMIIQACICYAPYTYPKLATLIEGEQNREKKM